MNKFYLIALSILFFQTSFAAPVIKATKTNGNWSTASSWDLNRVPKNGDTIFIPVGKGIFVSGQESLSNVYLKISGTLKFNNFLSYLSLNSTSSVLVLTGGSIEATIDNWQFIFLGNLTVFSAGLITGPQQANATTGSGFASFNPLPVKFVGFTVTRKNHDALVQWSTSEERDANMYEVEHSFDGSNWNTIAYVAAVGNSSALNNYSYTEKNITAKIIYYRVKQIDIDGQFVYTPVKSIQSEMTGSSDIKIAAVQGNVLLQFPTEITGALQVRFVSLSGQVIDQKTISHVSGQVVLSARVKGDYIISISNGQDINIAKEVIL